MIVYSLPTARGTGILKHCGNVEPFEELKIIRIELIKGFIVEPILVANFHILYLLCTLDCIDIAGV